METPLSFGADEPLPLTGERTAPGIAEENYWYQRHVAGYRYASTFTRGRRVLDAGCGEGYGSEMLAASAESVVAVDLDASVVDRARRRYSRARFDVANLVSLPYPDASFDVVVSLQVIEHIHAPHEFLAECARVSAPGGLVVLSTPNRLTFSPDGTRNPFHAYEFAPAELRTLLERQFSDVDVLGVFHAWRVAALEAVLRRPLPQRLIAQPADAWPAWLHAVVARIRPDDFRLDRARLDSSLDLLAVVRP